MSSSTITSKSGNEESNILAVPEHDFDYFVKPSAENMSKFLRMHPFQTTSDAVIRKAFEYPDGKQRFWLSYSTSKDALFCFVCLAFSQNAEHCSFTRGFQDRKHIHIRVQEHESAGRHKNCVDALILYQEKFSIDHVIDINLLSKRHEQVEIHRNVMRSIIDVIMLIGNCIP